MSGGDSSEVTVVVVEDHPVFRDGLVGALADRGIAVLADVADADGAVAAVVEHRPDVVLMDLQLAQGSGLDATRRILEADTDARILVLTMSEDEESIFAALRSGARGYLLKGAGADDIARAVSSLARGDAVLGATISDRVLSAFASRRPTGSAGDPFPELTEREHEVLELVARGLTNGPIARQLGLSEKTIRNYVSSILTKLQTGTRAQAVARARDAGLGTAG